MDLRLPRILCVDDEPFNLSLLEAVLLPRGYDVVLAGNGPKALEKIRSEHIDLCLLDVMMPGMDGFETCRRIKSDEEHHNIPVIMITASADQKDRIRGIESGAEDFISKPFDAAVVLARIKMLLHTKDLNDRLNAAYHNITKLSAFGEQIITNFDPVNFDFLEKIDSLVAQIISKSDRGDSPQFIMIGMLDQAGDDQWLQYDSTTRRKIDRNLIKMDIDHKLAFATSGQRVVDFYNGADADLTAAPLVEELKKHVNPVLNLVRYSNDSFCLLALNYDRKVTLYDATVLSSAVMQSLFLKSLAAQIKDTESAFEYTILALARASEANDEDTGNHILRVGMYCMMLARQLNLPDKFVQAIRIQAALHDVGKIHISHEILNKQTALTVNDWQEIRNHTLHGAKIIGGHPRMSMATRIALSHHEHYDGSGYPSGLSGEQIPIEARIITLADQYDALRNIRCYKPCFDHETSRRIIIEGDGRTIPQHFDPAVLKAFKSIDSQFAETYELMVLRRDEKEL